MAVDLDKMLKSKLVRGVRCGGFRGVRGVLCTKIAITRSIFGLEAQKFVC